MRRRARENPSTGTWLAIGGGAALLGVAAYFIFRKPAATTTTTTTTTTQLPVAAAAPTPPSQGSPTDPNSVAYACVMARKIYNSHPMTTGARKLKTSEYAYWSAKCTAGGGTV